MMNYNIIKLFRREIIAEGRNEKKSSSGGDYKQNVVYVSSAETAMSGCLPCCKSDILLCRFVDVAIQEKGSDWQLLQNVR